MSRNLIHVSVFYTCPYPDVPGADNSNGLNKVNVTCAVNICKTIHRMTQILRLMGRMYHISMTNSYETHCLACVSLRTGNRLYSTYPQVKNSIELVKGKKKWKKKVKKADSEGVHEEQFKLTEVLSRHIQNLRTSDSANHLQKPKDNVQYGVGHGKQQRKQSGNSKSKVQYKSEHSSKESVKSGSQSAHHIPRFPTIESQTYSDKQGTVAKDSPIDTPQVQLQKLKNIKKISQRSKKEEPAEQTNRTTSFQTTHFDQLSREKAKQIFAYKGSRSADETITLPKFATARVEVPTDNTSLSETTVPSEHSEEAEEAGDHMYDEKEWEIMKSMRRKKQIMNLLTFDQIRKLEMERDRHLQILDEPEENGMDALAIDLNDSFSVEGVITKKAKDKQAKLAQKQQKLEAKKLVQLKHSKESLSQVLIDQKTSVFNEKLRCYIDACVAAGLVDRAITDLHFYRWEFRSARIMTPITDIEIYNIILRGLAKQSDGKEAALDQTRKVFSWIREEGLQPTMESYCLCLASVGVNSDYNLLMASFIVKDMRTQGFDIQDAFNQCTFLHNEKHKLTKMFRLLIPDFKPNRPGAASKYEGSLVEKLNDPIPVSEMAQCNSLAGAITADEVMRNAETQFSRELDGFVKVESVFPQTKLSGLYEQKINETVDQWRKSIKAALIEKRNLAKRQAFTKPGMNLYPFLCLFPLDDYVDILTMTAQSLAMQSQHYSPDMHTIYDLASHIHARYMVHLCHNTGVFHKLHKIYTEYVNNVMNPNLPCVNQRLTWRKIQSKFKDGNSIELPNKKWSPAVLQMVGKELMEVLLSATEINATMFRSDAPERMVKGFVTVDRMRGDRMSREFMPHPVLVKLMNPTTDITFRTETLPMLCPPVPYLSSTFGGNFINTVETVRRCSADQGRMFEENSPSAGPVFDALNILGTCAWQINKPVLEVVMKIFRDGGDNDVDIPILPAKLEEPIYPKDKEPSRKEMGLYRKQRRLYRKSYSEATSLWWSMLYKLSIANKYKNETFWFPMNMDFRSRTYTVAPHLNHQGDDVNRGLIQFAKGMPLGKEGFDWLKIHLVNLTGLRKRSSNVDRLKFCDEMMPTIMDSADNPLTGKCWWRESEEPWQTLAACIEVTKAVRSGNPENYVSQLPVHQDGSCNGLQHYAALGRDELGARSVNLHPLDVPSDVYSEVLELVKKEIDKDIREKTKTAHLAKIAQKYIERKVIKQSVMTTVYGVTPYGARHQIARQLKYKNLDEKHMLDVSVYLTEKTFKSLNEMFTSAKKIQDWFNACATLMSSLDIRMEWMTPLNFPIIQSYTKALTHVRAFPGMDDSLKKVDSRKQVNAFAPNFIHSLDATHMMLTAIDCHRRGITFISVHDCFWTHPAYVDIMNKVTRQQFVSLYKQDILENLSRYLLKKCQDRAAESSDIARDMENIREILTAVPDTGNFELENVLQSTYFFS